jgi:two-component system, LytTR family, response regulator
VGDQPWIGNALSGGSWENRREPSHRLIIKSRGRVFIVLVDEIDWIEACANYVRLHLTGRDSHLFRQPISKIAEQLDSSRFVRIHRSYIVNVNRIRELQPCNSGEFIVSLRDGKELPCSRSYRHVLRALYSPGWEGLRTSKSLPSPSQL